MSQNIRDGGKSSRWSSSDVLTRLETDADKRTSTTITDARSRSTPTREKDYGPPIAIDASQDKELVMNSREEVRVTRRSRFSGALRASIVKAKPSRKSFNRGLQSLLSKRTKSKSPKPIVKKSMKEVSLVSEDTEVGIHDEENVSEPNLDYIYDDRVGTKPTKDVVIESSSPEKKGILHNTLREEVESIVKTVQFVEVKSIPGTEEVEEVDDGSDGSDSFAFSDDSYFAKDEVEPIELQLEALPEANERRKSQAAKTGSISGRDSVNYSHDGSAPDNDMEGFQDHIGFGSGSEYDSDSDFEDDVDFFANNRDYG